MCCGWQCNAILEEHEDEVMTVFRKQGGLDELSKELCTETLGGSCFLLCVCTASAVSTSLVHAHSSTASLLHFSGIALMHVHSSVTCFYISALILT
jgi:hypothetical protein